MNSHDSVDSTKYFWYTHAMIWTLVSLNIINSSSFSHNDIVEYYKKYIGENINENDRRTH
jgi:hypothetical protein